jgi:hypothetical protein
VSDAEGESPRANGLGRAQTGKALALVVVAALVAVLVLHHMGSSSARPTGSVAVAPVATTTTTPGAPSVTPTPTAKPTTTTVPLAAPADITVGVVNGLQAGNLATNLTARLKADGYRTLPPDNTTVLTRTSVIYVARSGYAGEATRLAAQLGLRAGAIQVESSLPSTAPIPAVSSTGADLVVVIGSSLQAEASTPPSTVAPPTTRPPATTTTTRPPSTTIATTPPTTVPPTTVPPTTVPSTTAAPPST